MGKNSTEKLLDFQRMAIKIKILSKCATQKTSSREREREGERVCERERER